MKKLNTIKEFKTWFRNTGWDINEDFDEIYDLYELIESVGNEKPIFTPEDSEIEPIEISFEIVLSAKRFLDSLFPEGGGVHGEDSRRNNMGKS